MPYSSLEILGRCRPVLGKKRGQMGHSLCREPGLNRLVCSPSTRDDALGLGRGLGFSCVWLLAVANPRSGLCSGDGLRERFVMFPWSCPAVPVDEFDLTQKSELITVTQTSFCGLQALKWPDTPLGLLVLHLPASPCGWLNPARGLQLIPVTLLPVPVVCHGCTAGALLQMCCQAVRL